MKNLEESPKKEVVQPQDEQTDQQIPKQEWPIGDLPDPNFKEQSEESVEDQDPDTHDESKGNGFDEWSSTWP